MDEANGFAWILTQHGIKAMLMSSCKISVVNINMEIAWPKFQQSLASAGCKEEDILFVWNKIKAEDQGGQVLLPSRTTPEKSFLGISGALELMASPRPKSNPEDIVVVWQFTERFLPGQVSVRIFR